MSLFPELKLPCNNIQHTRVEGDADGTNTMPSMQSGTAQKGIGARKMDEEEVLHIAVGKNPRKEKLNILWAAANFPRATIVLVHVHWPSKWMPFMGGRLLYKFADEMEKERHRSREIAAMVNMLSEYKCLCGTRKVRAYYLTHHNIIAGVVELVKKLKIKRIVIGSRNMTMQDVLSRCCQVWVVLSGKYISTSNDHVEHSGSFGHGGRSSYFETIQEGALKCKEEIDKLLTKLERRQGYGSHGDDRLLQRKISASLKENAFSISEHVDQFTMSQIRKATSRFNSRNLIGQGGYGPVYKGNLGGMPVAIKLLRPRGTQGFPEYLQEMVVLSRLEHPHIVKLVGVCPESCSLVYEHLPNGTLLDRLTKGGLPPFAWEDRVRILAEQRSALAYLHSSRPNAIIHADLKLSNILLDAGDVSRLGDFGTARVVPVKPLEEEEETIVRRTVPMGTMGYIDPVFVMTGKLTTASDVYAFGVVILQLLTGLDDLNIVEQARVAVKMRAVHAVLDASAGPWPKKPAVQLLKLALRCCSWETKRRPPITSNAKWKSLHTLRAMAVPANK